MTVDERLNEAYKMIERQQREFAKLIEYGRNREKRIDKILDEARKFNGLKRDSAITLTPYRKENKMELVNNDKPKSTYQVIVASLEKAGLQVKFVSRTAPSRELSLVLTKIEEALMWFNKVPCFSEGEPLAETVL